MRKSVNTFVILWMILSVISLVLVSYFFFLTEDRMAEFMLFISSFMVIIGIFFIVNRDKIGLYLQNYKREKEI